MYINMYMDIIYMDDIYGIYTHMDFIYRELYTRKF